MSSAPEGKRADDDPTSVRTITISERDIRAAAQLLEVLASDGDRGRELTLLARGNLHTIGSSDRSVLVERARQMYVNRARRTRVFNSKMFGEPAWDMLLALYVTDQALAHHTVSGLVSLSGAPHTTAIRWIDLLIQEGLFTRKPSPFDARVFWIGLTEEARQDLDAYFADAETESG